MDQLLSILNGTFDSLHRRSVALVDQVSDDELYRRPRELPHSLTLFTTGEYVLRSAATIEQAFGGITRRLWDDPFEWTLPEALNNTAKILGYLDEVAALKSEGFGYFRSDDDLVQTLPAPVEIKPVAQVLVEALTSAEHYLGRAYAIKQMLSDEKLPRL